jgi:streptogramin lyase
VEYPLQNSSSDPIAITSDRNGVIWVVEQGTNLLTSFDPSRQTFTDYRIPTPNSFPTSVAADGNGNVWFTELNGENLAELPLGQSKIQEFHIPSAYFQVGGNQQSVPCGPTGVSVDQSGNIWFGCLFSNQLGEFLPGRSVFFLYPLPVFDSGPVGIAFSGEDLWFSAADSDMLGHGIISEMKPNMSVGITEVAPQNKTYQFSFEHQLGLLGQSETIVSSLPTPSGISFSRDGKTLWLTEHVDDSFDSYNTENGELTRFWTSKTNGLYGYASSFPNGIAVDSSGRVWVGEHYGNKIALFDPNSSALTELAIPCCPNSISGAYSVTLDPQGHLWFVEVNAGKIGEVIPHSSAYTLYASVPEGAIFLDLRGSAAVDMTYNLVSNKSLTLSFDISGISSNGTTQNLTATFYPSSMTLQPGTESTVRLQLDSQGLVPGTYELTVSAATQGIVYSWILGVEVGQKTHVSFWFVLFLTAALTLVTLTAVSFLLRRSRRLQRRPR